jgi:NAD(P)-dependent dehydrogenase (short-subunit alcohol dehydrogenase family)
MPREVVERPREKRGPSATVRQKENAVLVSKNEQPATMTADRALGPFDLTGEVAIVTGGNGGIGLGMARGLAQAGAAVVIAGRDEANNVKAVAELRDAGARAIDVVADVTQEESCRALVATAVEAFGRLDILVNNAGIGIGKQPQDYTLAEWNTVLATNLSSAFFVRAGWLS